MLLTGHQYGALVDRVDTGQSLDQGRLARAVLAHQGVNLTGQQAEVDLVERFDTGKADADPAHLDHRRGERRRWGGSDRLGHRGISTAVRTARSWPPPGRRRSP